MAREGGVRGGKAYASNKCEGCMAASCLKMSFGELLTRNGIAGSNPVEPQHFMIIWKFPLEITDRPIALMPDGAQILTAQMQEQTLCVWALVDPSAPRRIREFEILGTGNRVPEAKRRYISTVQMMDKPLVWHVFEIM